MATFWRFTSIILLMTLTTTSPLQSSSSQFISVAPAAFSPYGSPTALPPYNEQEMSPETNPLFPTPTGDVVLPPTESSMPTIPASLSPPNPDALNDPAFAPADGSSTMTTSLSAACHMGSLLMELTVLTVLVTLCLLKSV
ncbi:hypothetical protein RND81_12G057100 [Saponaria officinalis]|uniref:Uncharacterized protein n=1 Tax=Saponaria officinalis TaxID=3572 RepID=A0AAW1H3L9_SAPOF